MTAPRRWGNAEREAFKGVARVLGAQFETRKIFGPCNMAWREEETVVFAGQSQQGDRAHQVTARADIARMVRRISDRHDLWSVWSDFVEMSAIALSNAVDFVQRAGREARYLQIAGKYAPDSMARFASAFGALANAFDEDVDDVLGGAFMELELGNKWRGQFFTPFSLCRTMAAMLLVDMKPTIEERGFVTASDPAVGAGAMPLALAAVMSEAQINYQTSLHVTAQDIDERAAHMAYIQLSLLGVPAIVVVGDTLRMEERARWYTPAHIIGGWSMKLRREPQPKDDRP